jgi:hypothetical protein
MDIMRMRKRKNKEQIKQEMEDSQEKMRKDH